MTIINNCDECLGKQRRIDELEKQLVCLKDRLRHQERKAEEGLFGSSTPSSKIPVKPNTAKGSGKPKGAKAGHKGSGRKKITRDGADRVEDVPGNLPDICERCGESLLDKGVVERGVIDSRPLKGEPVVQLLHKKGCPGCGKTYQDRAKSVLPKSLYGNQLVANAAVMHYLHGIPIGRVCEQIGLGAGSLVTILQRLARLFADVPERLIDIYRTSPVKHADETGWRTNGKNGYVWLFATTLLSIFRFRQSRSGRIPAAVFGKQDLPGVLVVDRYQGYNKAPCAIQYCYAHLLRTTEDLDKEFPDSAEVKAFVSTMVPLLSAAMNLRSQKITDEQFYERAAEIKQEILTTVNSPAQHLGIRHIQGIFRDNKERMYHWASNRAVPAENNLAERDLRPLVIARKVSFGSASDAGARTRETLMTVLHFLKKRGVDVNAHLKYVLDELTNDIDQDPYPLLFPKEEPAQH